MHDHPGVAAEQDFPTTPKRSVPPLNSGQQTECSWILDSPAAHIYRSLDIQYTAYSPSGLASGTGSATFAAEDAFAKLESSYNAKGSKQSTMMGLQSSSATDVAGMPGGTDTSAFQATQVYNSGGVTEYVAFDYVRYRNVIVRVTVQGNRQNSAGKTLQRVDGRRHPDCHLGREADGFADREVAD